MTTSDSYAEPKTRRGKARKADPKITVKPFARLTEKELAAMPRDEFLANLSPWLRDSVRKAWAASDAAKKQNVEVPS